MGVDKYANLILTAREDHNQSSPAHKLGGPKIHFDVGGYDVLFWSPADLACFRIELEKRIRRRVAIIKPPSSKPTPKWDTDWLKKQKFKAIEALKNAGLWGKVGLTEIQFAIANSSLHKTQSDLLRVAEQAQIHTFGWPIGVVLHNELAPRPVADGIVADVPASTINSYDYWTIRKDGAFYLLQSLFEDHRRPGEIFFDTRVVRITEALLYCARLYTRMGVPGSARIFFGVRHTGLKDRVLSSSAGRAMFERKSAEDEIYTETEFDLSSVDSRIVELVRELLEPLFEIFNFYRAGPERYAQIVNGFVQQSSK